MAWLHVHCHSEALRMPIPLEVLLPQYESEGSRGVNNPGPYAALYLLHGIGEDHTSWMRRTSLERYVEGLPLAVIMPAGHLVGYTDMKYGRNYFQFISEELPALCENMFPLSASREDRCIAGASIGGYGALKAGLLAPDTFSAAASFSGTLDVMGLYDRLDARLAADIFGSRDDVLGSANDLDAAAEQLAASGKKPPKLYMWCSTGEAHYDEQQQFKERILQLGLPLSYEEGRGDHGWTSWDQCVKRLIEWLPAGKQHE